jgi:hypothetical protein
LDPFIPDFAFKHLQLAEMKFDAIPGTATGMLVLRVMKAFERERVFERFWHPSGMLLMRVGVRGAPPVQGASPGRGRRPTAMFSHPSGMYSWVAALSCNFLIPAAFHPSGFPSRRLPIPAAFHSDGMADHPKKDDGTTNRTNGTNYQEDARTIFLIHRVKATLLTTHRTFVISV